MVTVFSVFHAGLTFRGAGSAVSALTLATGLGGCLDFRKVPWQLADEYECFGTCVICTEVDATGTCLATEAQSGNISSSGEVLGKLACGSNATEASDDCLKTLKSNVAAAFPDQAVQSCTPGVVITDAVCEADDRTGEAYPAGEAQAAMLVPDPSLGLTTLKLTSASSSLVANWRGSSATKALSGFLQYRERPFSFTFVRLWAPDTTIGGETFGKPNLRNRSTLFGSKDASGPVPSFTTGSVTNCTVAVNGTGSSDPDGGSIQSWRWSVNGRAAGSGPRKPSRYIRGRT